MPKVKVKAFQRVSVVMEAGSTFEVEESQLPHLRGYVEVVKRKKAKEPKAPKATEELKGDSN
jgi:hypothetical protein